MKIEWMLIIFLVILVLYLIAMYRRVVTERNNLVSFVIQILLDESAYQIQKEGLAELVRNSDATKASELTAHANIAVVRLANRIGLSTGLYAGSLLLQLKIQQRTALKSNLPSTSPAANSVGLMLESPQQDRSQFH